jgi:hypothetical protein
MTTKQIEQVEEIDSPYFGEEDVLDIQTRLIDMGYIDPVTDQNAALADPLVLAKSLDRLMDILIAGLSSTRRTCCSTPAMAITGTTSSGRSNLWSSKIGKLKMNKETEITGAERAATIKRLEDKRDEYQGRLDEGAVKIEEARRQGKDVSEWESYWLELLKRYGHLSDKIRELQNF